AVSELSCVHVPAVHATLSLSLHDALPILTRRRNQDVGRLQVAVHDHVAVGELDRIGGLQHEADAPVDIQLLLVGVAVDRYAVDVLHDEPRATVVGHATVDELRDTAVTERGEDLALLPEAGGDVRNAERAVQHFHGDATLEHAVRALAEVDRA